MIYQQTIRSFLRNSFAGIIGFAIGTSPILGLSQDVPNDKNLEEMTEDIPVEEQRQIQDYHEQTQEKDYPSLLQNLADETKLEILVKDGKAKKEDLEKALQRNYDIYMLRDIYDDLEPIDRILFKFVFIGDDRFEKKFLSTKYEKDAYERYFPDVSTMNERKIESMNEDFKSQYPWKFDVREVYDKKNNDPFVRAIRNWHYFINALAPPGVGEIDNDDYINELIDPGNFIDVRI